MTDFNHGADAELAALVQEQAADLRYRNDLRRSLGDQLERTDTAQAGHHACVLGALAETDARIAQRALDIADLEHHSDGHSAAAANARDCPTACVSGVI